MIDNLEISQGLRKIQEEQLAKQLQALLPNPNLMEIISEIAQPKDDPSRFLSDKSAEYIASLIGKKMQECVCHEYQRTGELLDIPCAVLGISKQRLQVFLNSLSKGLPSPDANLIGQDIMVLDNPAHYMKGVQILFRGLFSLADGYLSWKKWLFDVIEAFVADLCAAQKVDWPGMGRIDIVQPEANPNRYLDSKKTVEGMREGAVKDKLEKQAQQRFALRLLIAGLTNRRFGKINWESMESQAQFGGYLFSVVVFSGVQSFHKLKQIVALSLAKQNLDPPYSSLWLPANSALPVDSAYITWERALKKSKGGEIQFPSEMLTVTRWIPDPLSASLHANYRPNWVFSNRGEAFEQNCLQAFMNSLKESLRQQPNRNQMGLGKEALLQAIDLLSNRTALMHASQSWGEDTLPTYVARYLEGKISTKDLQIDNLHQLGLSDVVMPQTKIERQTLEEAASEIEPHSPIHMMWIEQLIGALTGLELGNPISVTHCLSKIGKIEQRYQISESALTRSLMKWVRYLITEEWCQGRLSLKKLMEYVCLLLPLAVADWDLDEGVEEFTDEDWIEEFIPLLAQITLPEDQKTFKKAWESLRDAFTAPKKKGIRPASEVDVGYVSELEFRLIQHDLYTVACRNKSVEFKNECLLVLTLAYRLGLRRSEVLKLATQHIQQKSGYPTIISLQWWKYRRLKSLSSIRVLPIEALLEPREMKWLDLWLSARKVQKLCTDELISEESNTKEADQIRMLHGDLATSKDPEAEQYSKCEMEFLFPVPLSSQATESGKDEPASNDERDKIIDCIHESMRRVTKNRFIRFHHLRHSAAINTLMLLMAPLLLNSERFILDHLYGGKNVKRRLSEGYKALGTGDLANPLLQIGNLKRRMGYARYFLLNNPDASISELYAVATLLGHSSPSTTLHSYLHVIDLLTGAFLHERLLKFDDGLLNSLYPGTQRNLDIRRARCQTPFDEKNPRLDQVPTLLNEVLKPGPKEKLVAIKPLSLEKILNPKNGHGIEWACERLQSLIEIEDKKFSKTAMLAEIPEILARQWVQNAIALTNQAGLFAPNRSYLYEGITKPLPKAYIIKKPRMNNGVEEADKWITKALKYFQTNPEHTFILLDYAKQRLRARADSIKFTQKELGVGQFKRKGLAVSTSIDQIYKAFFKALEIKFEVVGKNRFQLNFSGKAEDDLAFAFRAVMILLGTLYSH